MNKPIDPGSRLTFGRKPATDLVPPPSGRTPAPSWPDAAPYADLLIAARRRRSRRLILQLAGFVLLPTVVTAFYVLVIASPRYVSHAELTYQIYRPPDSLSAGLAQSFSGTSQNNNIDLGAIVTEFIRSDTIVRRLIRTLPLKAALSDRRLDWFSRLDPDASMTGLLGAYRSLVSAYEGLGGYVTVDVTTADPVLSLNLARAIVDACGGMVDSLSAHARDDALAFAEAEVTRQEDRVRHARLALTAFQDAFGNQDPQRAAGQLGNIVGSLESDLTAAHTQLAEASPFLKANAPALQQLRARIASVSQQLEAEKARLAGPDGTPFSRLLADYSRLQLDEEFARTAYTQAQQGLAVARADAARKQNYLVDFVEPALPDRADWRGPIRAIASVFLGTLLASIMLSILGGALRDQTSA